MKIVSQENHEGWLAWRRAGITASDAAVIAGFANRPTRTELWAEKVGRGLADQEAATEAMQFGLLLEDDILEMYTRKTGVTALLRQVSVESESVDFPMRATLDAVASDGRLLECKAVSIGGANHWPEDGDWENLPSRVLFQVQHQMSVADRDRCDVIAFLPLQLRIYPVRRRDDLIAPLIEMEEEFWRYVADETPPPPLSDAEAESCVRALGVADRCIPLGLDVQEVADDYDKICEDIRELEFDKKRIRERLIAAMAGNRHASLPDGRMLDCNVIHVAERVQTVKAHQQVRLSIKHPKT
jgi:putative phage-type endonuclease